MLNFFNKIKQQVLNALKSPTWLFTVPLVIFLPLIFIRVFARGFEDPTLIYLVWGFGTSLLYLSWINRSEFLISILNSYSLQLFMYVCLRLENIAFSFEGVSGLLMATAFFSGIINTPAFILDSLGFDTFIWYWFLLLVFGTYFRLRTLFLFPHQVHIQALNDSRYMRTIQKPEDFNWNFVITKINVVSSKLYDKSIVNRLSPALGSAPFTNVGVRYMGNIASLMNITGDAGRQLSKVVGQASTQEKAVAGAVVLTGTVGALLEGVKINQEGVKINQRDRDLDIKQQEADTRKQSLDFEKRKYEDSRRPESVEVSNVSNQQTPVEAPPSDVPFINPIFRDAYRRLSFNKPTPKDSPPPEVKTKAPSLCKEPVFFDIMVKKLSVFVESIFTSFF